MPNIKFISLLYVVSAIIYRQKSLDEVVHWYFGVFRLAGPSVGELIPVCYNLFIRLGSIMYKIY